MLFEDVNLDWLFMPFFNDSDVLARSPIPDLDTLVPKIVHGYARWWQRNGHEATNSLTVVIISGSRTGEKSKPLLSAFHIVEQSDRFGSMPNYSV